jgi:isoquinoline 1-oxidoreductase beta subunit
VVEADYRVPFLAHAAMEPVSCTARVREGGCELWLSTQAPTLDAAVAAQLLGIEPSAVQVHPCFVGGGFGRRAGPEHVQEAVLLARVMRRPVKVIWSRGRMCARTTCVPPSTRA